MNEKPEMSERELEIKIKESTVKRDYNKAIDYFRLSDYKNDELLDVVAYMRMVSRDMLNGCKLYNQ